MSCALFFSAEELLTCSLWPSESWIDSVCVISPMTFASVSPCLCVHMVSEKTKVSRQRLCAPSVDGLYASVCVCVTLCNEIIWKKKTQQQIETHTHTQPWSRVLVRASHRMLPLSFHVFDLHKQTAKKAMRARTSYMREGE